MYLTRVQYCSMRINRIEMVLMKWKEENNIQVANHPDVGLIASNGPIVINQSRTACFLLLVLLLHHLHRPYITSSIKSFLEPL